MKPPAFLSQRPLYLVECLTIAAVLWVVGWCIVMPSTKPIRLSLEVLRSDWAKVLSSGVMLYLFDRLLLWPYLRNPLRRLFPTIYTNGILRSTQLLLEEPRGTTPLAWFKQHPTAHALHTHGLIEGSTILPISPDALRDVFSAHAYGHTKPAEWAALDAPFLGWGLILSEGARYRTARGIMLPHLRLESVRGNFAVVRRKAGLLAGAIGRGGVGVGVDRDYMDVTPFALRYVLDVSSASLLCYDWDALVSRWDDADTRLWERTLNVSQGAVRFLSVATYLPVGCMKLLPLRINRARDRRAKALRRICWKILESAKLQNGEGKPLPHQALRQIVQSAGCSVAYPHVPHGWSRDNYRRDHMGDPYLTLAENLCHQETLISEIDNVVAGRDFEHEELERMVYLNAVVEEVLRLHPPLPYTSRATCKPISIVGRTVPTGTAIHMWVGAINRNPQYWGPKADVFDPSRWITIDEHGIERANKHGGASSNYQNMTFLQGPRICAGRDFSKMWIKTALVEILRKFSVSRSREDSGEVKARGWLIVRPVAGPRVKFTPRS
ncbi:cytochrome P450 [Pseudovirgaria hyperparasitica]|uniref:Cytochrome P450 n=1 Tax=Pseudovirgaria hyperparasitica TaxID=470096 RepID=A0A6A6WC12_9PEZI|nr:cytochrome P450 [Pseudovirgaria hyperparasitica]KAF2759386.1 cytochrome P450 [Pseudovirgaria hyperparasitica]